MRTQPHSLDDTPPDRITDLLRKVKALADRGIAGERDAARFKLASLMAKYGLTLADIAGDEIVPCDFIVAQVVQKLFTQVACEVLRVRTLQYSHRPGRKRTVQLDCTRAQAADIAAMFAHYLAIYTAERKALRLKLRTLASAVIHRFDIGANIPEDPKAKPTELTEAEKAALIELMAGLNGAKFIRPAAQLTA